MSITCLQYINGITLDDACMATVWWLCGLWPKQHQLYIHNEPLFSILSFFDMSLLLYAIYVYNKFKLLL
jgi:hypothetical protein